MSTHPDSVPDAYAVKTREGVTLYADRERRHVIETWPYWRTTCPDSRMRWIHNVRGCTYRLRWLNL